MPKRKRVEYTTIMADVDVSAGTSDAPSYVMVACRPFSVYARSWLSVSICSTSTTVADIVPFILGVLKQV